MIQIILLLPTTLLIQRLITQLRLIILLLITHRAELIPAPTILPEADTLLQPRNTLHQALHITVHM